MKRFLTYILLIFLFIFIPVSAQTDPKISSIISRVNIDSLYENLLYLTGGKMVNSSYGQRYITSRYYLHDGNIAAEEYLLSRLKKYFPASASMQYFDGGGGNVIAVQRGSRYPDKYIIICAHFDSMPAQGPAPGADDNGSGSSAVLEAARILKDENPDYSIVYALWDNEEIGLKGSYYYAQQASVKKDDIVAVINMDMIGWDSNNDFLAEIHTRNIAGSYQLKSELVKVNSDYNIGLQLAVINPGSTSSDHSSFWTFNFPAVLLIEGYYSNDFNGHYHSSNDNISFINRTYFEKCAKAAIGTMANLAFNGTATSVEPYVPAEYKLAQNYPNPFNPSTTIKYSIEKESHVKLVVYDVLGKEIETLVNQFQKPDNYTVKFEASRVSSGIYFYKLTAGNQVSVKKMVLAR